MWRKVRETLGDKWLQIRCKPIDATLTEIKSMNEEWNRWLDRLGVKRLSMGEVESYANLYRDGGTPEGNLLIKNPASTYCETKPVLLVPKDVAEKLLFLGLP